MKLVQSEKEKESKKKKEEEKRKRNNMATPTARQRPEVKPLRHNIIRVMKLQYSDEINI